MNQHESRKVAMQAVYLANQEPDLNAEEVEAKVVATLNLKQLSAFYIFSCYFSLIPQINDPLQPLFYSQWLGMF